MKTNPVASSCLSFPLLSLLVLISLLLAWRPAYADAAPPPDPTVAGIGPYQPMQTDVQMTSESVWIDVPPQPAVGEPTQITVRAEFILRNQGKTEEQMQVIFPLTRLNFWTTEEALYSVDLASFTAKVDGQEAAITEITTPPELAGYDADHGYVPEVRWAAFEVRFPVRTDVKLEIGYRMLNDYGLDGSPVSGFTGIAYMLETGAGWYGTIGSAEITLHLPYPASEEAIMTAKPGYRISGNDIRWELKEFEPSRKDNLEVSVVNSTTWQRVLEMRAAVQAQPANAQAWAELGDLYTGLGYNWMAGVFSLADPHFAGLALQARQKAVELLPGSGEAHFKLAEILWLGNPTVQSWLQIGGNRATAHPSLEDSSLQQIVAELELARSLGFTGDLIGFYEAFPQLRLSATGTPEVATVQPTGTVEAPASTSTLQQVVLVAATSQPTPADPPLTREGMVSAALCFLIAIGVFFYLRHSQSRQIGYGTTRKRNRK